MLTRPPQVFLFQFVNNYFVLFYISIIRPFYHSCGKELELPAGNGTYIDTSMCVQSDLAELQFQLMVVFTGKSLGQSLAEMLKPKLRLYIKRSLMEDKMVKQLFETIDESYNTVFDNIAPTLNLQGDSDDEDIDAVETGMVQHRMTTTASASQASKFAGLADGSHAVADHEVGTTQARLLTFWSSVLCSERFAQGAQSGRIDLLSYARAVYLAAADETGGASATAR